MLIDEIRKSSRRVTSAHHSGRLFSDVIMSKYGNTDLVSVQLGEPEVGRGHEEPKVLAIGWDLVGAAGRQEAVEVLDRQAAVRAPVHEDAHHPVSLSVK